MTLCSVCCGRWNGGRIGSGGSGVRHGLRLGVVGWSCIRSGGSGCRTWPPWRGVSQVLRVDVEPASGTSSVFGFREPRYQTRRVKDVRARKADDRGRGVIIGCGTRNGRFGIGAFRRMLRSDRVGVNFGIFNGVFGQQIVPADCTARHLATLSSAQVFVRTRYTVNPRHPLH